MCHFSILQDYLIITRPPKHMETLIECHLMESPMLMDFGRIGTITNRYFSPLIIVLNVVIPYSSSSPGNGKRLPLLIDTECSIDMTSDIRTLLHHCSPP